MTGKIALGKNYVFISVFSENLVSCVLNSDITERDRRAERQGKDKRLECMEGTRSTLKNVGGETKQTTAAGHYRFQHQLKKTVRTETITDTGTVGGPCSS